jgi:3-dehydroquinate dehydratase-2
MRITIINGPNLNLLGTREPQIYGNETLKSLNKRLNAYAKEKGAKLRFFQTSYEGEIIDILHGANSGAVILNPGAYAHYSYALRDAIAAISTPVIEVHISDIYNREEFRRTSVLSDVCKAVISGQGVEGYFKAIDLCLQKD